MARFVILFPGRVGSTFLVSALDAHPDIEAKGERLDPLRTEGAAAQLDWARRYLKGRIVNRYRAVGFKTKLRDVVDKHAFADLARELDVRIILLDRRNDVKHVVSRITARALKDTTGRWNRYAGDGAGRADAVTIDADDFDVRLRAVVAEKASIVDYVATLGLVCLHVDYEDLLAEPDATFAQVLGFLGIRVTPMTGATVKNTSDDLRDVIHNFDEVRSRYVDTIYEAMFDEVLV